MTYSPRKTAFATVAALMLAAPAAFAQEQAPPPAEPAAAATAAPAPAPQSSALSWADVDSNQDGNVGKDESAVVPALAQVFDQADGDADGQLTPQEYQAFVANAQTGGAAPPAEGQPSSDGGE